MKYSVCCSNLDDYELIEYITTEEELDNVLAEARAEYDYVAVEPVIEFYEYANA